MSEFPAKQFYKWFRQNFGYTRLQKLDKCVDEYGGLENCVKEIMAVAFDDVEEEQTPLDDVFFGLMRKVMNNKTVSSTDNSSR